MGVSLFLEALPEKINKREWEKVYLETLKLVRAYPFSMLKEIDIHGEKVPAISLAVEQEDENRYWKISGDFVSMKRGETFMLYKDLNNYTHFTANNLGDILKYRLEDRMATIIFDSKTQGYPYHRYILAICCLIEHRLSGSAILYGNFDDTQAQKAIDWANSILDTPIDLPIVVNYRELYNRLKQIKNGKVYLKDFYYLAQNGKGMYEFIKENFNEREIFDFFKDRMKDYHLATVVGNINIMIDFLNMGYSVEDLCDLCCLQEDGPKFQEEDFVSALCSTWIFVPEENRKAMDVFVTPEGKSDTVYSLFGKAFLTMSRLMGMNIEKYIPKDEITSILKYKLKCLNNVDSIIKEKNKTILKTLEEIMKYRNRMKKQFKSYEESNTIYDLEYCIYWKEGIGLSEDIITLMEVIKDLLGEINSKFEESGHFENLGMTSFSHTKYMQIIAKTANSANIILSTKAWDWIKSINDNNILNNIIFILITLCKDWEKNKCDLAIALLENRELFFKYMI